jgi:transcriptional regulator
MSDADLKARSRKRCPPARHSRPADSPHARSRTAARPGIARTIQRQSEEVFFVDHGSLYLALQRLEEKAWISARWGTSEKNRKARFYTLTAKGREQLVKKTSQWRRLAGAMARILWPEEAGV